MCLFETEQQFTITLKYFRQQAPFQTVLEHKKTGANSEKLIRTQCWIEEIFKKITG